MTPNRLDASRRRLLAGAVCLLAVPPLLAAPTPVQLWKSPQCGCCKDWIKHLEAQGFSVQVHDDGNTDARARLRMPLRYGSCHTALIGGYAIEGHVPAREIRRLLAERPQAVGLAVPGMPASAPGMESYGAPRAPYEVLLVLADGSARTYQNYS